MAQAPTAAAAPGGPPPTAAAAAAPPRGGAQKQGHIPAAPLSISGGSPIGIGLAKRYEGVHIYKDFPH